PPACRWNPGPGTTVAAQGSHRNCRGALSRVRHRAGERSEGARRHRGRNAPRHLTAGAAGSRPPRAIDATGPRPVCAGDRRSSGRPQTADRVRRRPAAGGALAHAGLLRARARAVDLQRARPADAPSAGAERTRPAGDAGPRGILGTALPGDPPRADAPVPEARLARKRCDRLATFSESPPLTATRPRASPPHHALPRAARRIPRTARRAEGTAPRVPSPRSPDAHKT